MSEIGLYDIASPPSPPLSDAVCKVQSLELGPKIPCPPLLVKKLYDLRSSSMRDRTEIALRCPSPLHLPYVRAAISTTSIHNFEDTPFAMRYVNKGRTHNV